VCNACRARKKKCDVRIPSMRLRLPGAIPLISLFHLILGRATIVLFMPQTKCEVQLFQYSGVDAGLVLLDRNRSEPLFPSHVNDD
jgi:hypothetical protein